MSKGLRYNEGKPEWGLVDFKSLEPMVRVLEYGKNKYSKDNWKKGMTTVQVCESLLRHVFAYLDGEDIDSESKCSHIGHILCNAMFLEHTMREHKQFDNRSNGQGEETTATDRSTERVRTVPQPV